MRYQNEGTRRLFTIGDIRAVIREQEERTTTEITDNVTNFEEYQLFKGKLMGLKQALRALQELSSVEDEDDKF